MAYLEITVQTNAQNIGSAVAALTADSGEDDAE